MVALLDNPQNCSCRLYQSNHIHPEQGRPAGLAASCPCAAGAPCPPRAGPARHQTLAAPPASPCRCPCCAQGYSSQRRLCQHTRTCTLLHNMYWIDQAVLSLGKLSQPDPQHRAQCLTPQAVLLQARGLLFCLTSAVHGLLRAAFTFSVKCFNLHRRFVCSTCAERGWRPCHPRRTALPAWHAQAGGRPHGPGPPQRAPAHMEMQPVMCTEVWPNTLAHGLPAEGKTQRSNHHPCQLCGTETR